MHFGYRILRICTISCILDNRNTEHNECQEKQGFWLISIFY